MADGGVLNAYHPERDEVVHWSLWRSGMIIEGVFQEPDADGHVRLDFTVHWPPGTPPGQPTRWYSVERRLGEDRYAEEAFFEVDGAWRPASSITYVRRAGG